MATATRKLEVVIAGDAGGALRAFGDVDNRAGRLGRGISSAARIGAVGLAGLATGGAAVAVGLFQVGSSFDEAFDTIRIGTGATGAELEGLKTDFRNVVRDVPASFEDASAAIAGLNSRLGLSGTNLENVAEPLLEVTRITGGDLQSNIAAATRVFGDWGVRTRDMAPTLDRIFAASQETGAGFDSLSSNVVQFGAPLRQMGFSLDESLALFGKFEAEGVNVSTVLGGMRRGLAGFAEDGEAPADALARVSEEIKNAGSVADANRMAIEVFGSRAGPDMAAAIREGRFEIDELASTIAGGRGAIMAASDDTKDFGERWTEIKNRVFLALEPAANSLFEGIGTAMDKLGPVIGRVGDWLGTRLPGWIAQARAAIETLRPVFENIVAAVQQRWPEIQRIVTDVLAHISSTISEVTETIRSVWRNFGDDILSYVRGVWGPIVSIVRGAIQTLRGVIQAVLALIRGDWGKVWDGIKTALSGVWRLMMGVVRGYINAIRSTIRVALQLIANAWGVVWRGIQTLLRGIWQGITGIIRGALSTVRSALSSAWSAIRSAASNAWNGVRTTIGNVWQRIREVVRNGVNAVVDFVRNIPTRIANFARGMFDGIVEAFRDAVNAIVDWWNGLEFSIPGYDIPGPGPNIPGFTIGTPNIPRMATGGRVTRSGLALVGEDGPEILALGRGATVSPLGTGQIVHVHLEGPIFGADEAAVERMIVGALARARRKGLVGA